MLYDVVIVGGGPAGLSAALTLGRARKRVLLCDAGPRRNAAAERIHGFVTRDATTPGDFRRIARQQLERYPSVEVRDVRVEAIEGERGAFEVMVETGRVEARRILLCTGMSDELPDIEGFRALWGKSIFICPYCHGWEVQDRRIGVLVPNADALEFPLLLRGWTSHVVMLTNGGFDIPTDTGKRLIDAGVRIDRRSIARLAARNGRLERVEFAEGGAVSLDVLFTRPSQRQVPIVMSMGVPLDSLGYVQVDETHRETSLPGVYAAGDLVTPAQGAMLAAASGMHTAAMLNHALTIEMATSDSLVRTIPVKVPENA